MNTPYWILVAYALLAMFASLAGGWLLLLVNLTHTRLQVVISFVAGLMLGIALLHFLPDAAEELNSVDRTASWMVGGFLVMFFLQRFFHFHHHDLPEGDPEDCCHEEPEHEPHANHGHEDQHGHEATHAAHAGEPAHHAHTLAEKSAQHLSWAGAALGLTLHSLVDGMALAAAFEAGRHEHLRLAGLGVTLAVILHKPFDAMAISSLMTVTGKSKMSRHVLNGLFALATPLGMVLFYLGALHFADSNSVFLGTALAFCAGTFLCIAGSDLLPELQFHSHDRLKLSVALIGGLGLAVLIGQFETGHHPRDTEVNPTAVSTNHP